MNDRELDEILDSWTEPPAPVSLREGARAAFSAATTPETIPAARTTWKTAFARRIRRGLVAVAAVALGASVLVVTQAIPQTLNLLSPQVHVPYTVDSEFVQYASDRPPQVVMRTTSFSQDGNEVLLSRTLPGDPIGTAIARTVDAGVLHILPHRRRTPEMEEKINAAKADPGGFIGLLTDCDRPTCWFTGHYYFSGVGGVATGCAQAGAVAHETILDYTTVEAQRPLGASKRMTLWMAPDLGCFALRVTLEERGPDGAFHLVSRKQALKVTLNP